MSEAERVSAGGKDPQTPSAEERAKGFVRPVRRTYICETCGTETTMGEKIAETYARDPASCGSTFCAMCREYYPVGEHGQFIWSGSGEKVGT